MPSKKVRSQQAATPPVESAAAASHARRRLQRQADEMSATGHGVMPNVLASRDSGAVRVSTDHSARIVVTARAPRYEFTIARVWLSARKLN
jgi:hypothetical protein